MKSIFITLALLANISATAKEVDAKKISAREPASTGEYCGLVSTNQMSITIQHVQFQTYVPLLPVDASGCFCVKGTLNLDDGAGLHSYGKYEAYFSSVVSVTPATTGCGQ